MMDSDEERSVILSSVSEFSQPESDLIDDANCEYPTYNDASNEAGISDFSAFMHNLKSNIGVGLLALPQAVYRGGLVFGPIAMIIIFLPILHCMLQVLESAKVISEKYRKDRIGYAGTARYAFKPYLKERSKYICYTINLFLITSQLGVCSALFLFMANTMNSIFEGALPSIHVWLVVLYGFFLPLSMLKDINTMFIFSAFASLFCMAGFFGTLVAVFFDIKEAKAPTLVQPVHSTILFFTSIIYAYEGIPAMMPLYNKVANKKNYKRTVIISMISTLSIMMTMGFVGAYVYGDQIKPSITLNLPENNIFNTIKLVYSLGVFLTYFLQLYVTTSIIFPALKKRIQLGFKLKCAEHFTVFICVTCTFVAAISIPQLDNLISLVGAVSCSSLSLIFPPAIYMATFWKRDPISGKPPISKCYIFYNLMVMLLGVFLGVFGLAVTIQEIVKQYNA